MSPPQKKDTDVSYELLSADLRRKGDQIGSDESNIAQNSRPGSERPFGVDAWVVMSDHLYCVWTLPEGDADYSVRWGAIKARFVMAVCRAGFSPPSELPRVQSGRFAGLKPGLRVAKREVGIWQRRFWEHHIRNEKDFEAHARYCWGNPVKHAYVKRAVDWPYSSIHRDILAGPVGAEWSGAAVEGDFGERARGSQGGC